MVRYLDNKVVTIKGERYTEIKEDPEAAKDEAHKKTFVALKPARQYRFHWLSRHQCPALDRTAIVDGQTPWLVLK